MRINLSTRNVDLLCFASNFVQNSLIDDVNSIQVTSYNLIEFNARVNNITTKRRVTRLLTCLPSHLDGGQY